MTSLNEHVTSLTKEHLVNGLLEASSTTRPREAETDQEKEFRRKFSENQDVETASGSDAKTREGWVGECAELVASGLHLCESVADVFSRRSRSDAFRNAFEYPSGALRHVWRRVEGTMTDSPLSPSGICYQSSILIASITLYPRDTSFWHSLIRY